MLWTPPAGLRRISTNLSAPSTTPGASIADPASANTKSSWSSLGTLTADCHLMRLGFYDYHATASNNCCLIDIGFDSSGGTSYTVVAANLLGGYSAVTDLGSTLYYLPLYIPSGAQWAWRMQGARTNDTIRLVYDLYGAKSDPQWVAQTCDSYGPNTSDSGAVALGVGDSGAAGTWTEITASTTRDHEALICAVTPPGSVTALTALGYNVDLGKGAGGSEVSLVDDLMATLTTTSEAMSVFPGFIPTTEDIPSGTRLVMRASCSGTSEGLDGAIYGLS